MTDIESTFLTLIEIYPDQAGPKLRYADWLDEHGRGSDADAMRWLASLSIGPYFGYGYFYHLMKDGRESVAGLNFKFPRLDEFAKRSLPWRIRPEKQYESFLDMIKDFFRLFGKATAQPSWFWRWLGYKAWVPDYTPTRQPKDPLLLPVENRDDGYPTIL